MLLFPCPDYDGGDCCECTCDPANARSLRDFACDQFVGFACIDPNAACVDDDDITVDMLGLCAVLLIGDGECDDYNNKPECGKYTRRRVA